MNGLTVQRVVDCPRCHQQCGWCSDPRWLHGALKLPGLRRRCTLGGLDPEGDDCPVCHGSRKARAITNYTAEPKDITP